MKTLALVCCGALLLLAGCAHEKVAVAGYVSSAVPPEQQALWTNPSVGARPWSHNKAVIRATRGMVEISVNGGATWKKAPVGSVVKANSIVRTGKTNSVADFFLAENGPMIRLKEDSVLRFERLDFSATGVEKIIVTRLELVRGRMLGSVKKLAAASSFMVRTPSSIVQIRGTEFSVSGDGAVELIFGQARVFTEGQQFEVNAGFEFTPKKGVTKLSMEQANEFSKEISPPVVMGYF